MTQRGWVYILIGLLMSTFLGGAIRVFFSPYRIRSFVESSVKKKQPKFEIEFESAELRLASSWWPTIAVELRNLKVQAKDRCLTNALMTSDDLLVPIHLRSLLSGQMKFGFVRAGQVQVLLRPPMCSPQRRKGPENEQDDMSSIERFFQKRWSKEVVNTTRFLDEFTMESLVVKSQGQVDEVIPATVLNFSMKFLPHQAESRIEFSLKMGEPWVGPTSFGPIQVKLDVRADEVRLEGDGNLKEGQFQIQGQWAIERGDMQLQLAAQDIPGQSVLQLAQHYGQLKAYNPSLKNQWLTCNLNLSGPIRDFRELPVHVHQCRFYGDLGEIQIKNEIVGWTHGGEEQGLRLQIQDLEVKRMLSTLGAPSHLGFISQFGRFTGELYLAGENAVEMAGAVRGSELYFAALSERYRQKIDAFHMKLTASGQDVAVNIEDFIVPGGKVHGGLELRYVNADDVNFVIDMPKIELPHELQKEIPIGSTSALSLKGEGVLAQSKLKSFSGQVQLSEWVALPWELSGVRVQTDYVEGVWRFKSEAGQFRLRPESRWEPFVHSLASDVGMEPDDLLISDLSAEWMLTGPKGEWTAFAAAIGSRAKTGAQAQKGSRAKITSRGNWTAKGLSGVLTTQVGRKKQDWDVSGYWYEPRAKVRVSAAP